MAIFLGESGHIRLRRGSGAEYGSFVDVIAPDDVTIGLNRLSFDSALDNLLTGDRLVLSTDDSRGLACFAPGAWRDNTVNDDITAFINVNPAGGLRFFERFEDAINNNRSAELPVAEFTGDPIKVDYRVRDTRFNLLGNVTGYTLNTEREAIDVTSLSDKFRKQYGAGLLSGNGTIDCFFDYKIATCPPDPVFGGAVESSLLLLQLIQRVDIGSQFDVALYLTSKDYDKSVASVYYETSAVITRAGVDVNSTDIIQCSIDFVTTGEIRLLIGEPAGYILKEDDDLIELEQSLDFLLKEVED